MARSFNRSFVSLVAGALLLTGINPTVAGGSPSLALPERGVSLEFFAGPSTPPNADLFNRAVAYGHFISGLGANAVSLVIQFYTPSIESNVVTAGRDVIDGVPVVTPSPTQVSAVVRGLSRSGLRVYLRPLINEHHLGLKWRGDLSPVDSAQWFKSYRSALEPYLTMAEDLHVHGFVIISELSKLSRRPGWSDLISWSRRYFHGTLVWDVNLAPRIVPAPVAGLVQWNDMYPRVPAASDGATVARILRGWDDYIATMPIPGDPQKQGIGEIGIVAQNGAYVKSSVHSLPTAYNESVQEKWFRAGCEYAIEHRYRSLFFWTLNFGVPVAQLVEQNRRYPMYFQPNGLKAIKWCFTRR